MSLEKRRAHIGPYELGKKIGEGTFGQVRLGRNVITQEKVAVKVVHHKAIRNESERTLIEREEFALSQLSHPNIVKLYRLFDDAKSGCYYIVVEYVGGGELFDYIVSHGRLRERDARRFIRQIVSALDYCHAHMIVHRDLKPENVLLDEHLNIKITDFGLSNMMCPGKKFKTFCGSLHYACPEILLGEEYVGPGADIWSVGIILYCLVTGSQPWNASTSEEILHQIFCDGISIPAWLTPECTDLLLRMLCLTEKDRITLDEIRRHPWVVKGYDGSPPPSYLPIYPQLDAIDKQVVEQMILMGFVDTAQLRLEILNGGQTSLIAIYHSLLRKQKCRRSGEFTSAIDGVSSTNSRSNASNGSNASNALGFLNSDVLSSDDLLSSTDRSLLPTKQQQQRPSVAGCPRRLSAPSRPPKPPPQSRCGDSVNNATMTRVADDERCSSSTVEGSKVSRLFDRIKPSFWRLLGEGFRLDSSSHGVENPNVICTKRGATILPPAARPVAKSVSFLRRDADIAPVTHRTVEKRPVLNLEDIAQLVQKNGHKCPRLKQRTAVPKRRMCDVTRPNISKIFAPPVVHGADRHMGDWLDMNMSIW